MRFTTQHVMNCPESVSMGHFSRSWHSDDTEWLITTLLHGAFSHLDSSSFVWSVSMALSALTMTARADVTPAFSSLLTRLSMKSFLSWGRQVYKTVYKHAYGMRSSSCSTYVNSDVVVCLGGVAGFVFLPHLPLGAAPAHAALRTWPVEQAQVWSPSFRRSWCS